MIHDNSPQTKHDQIWKVQKLHVINEFHGHKQQILQTFTNFT